MSSEEIQGEEIQGEFESYERQKQKIQNEIQELITSRHQLISQNDPTNEEEIGFVDYEINRLTGILHDLRKTAETVLLEKLSKIIPDL